MINQNKTGESLLFSPRDFELGALLSPAPGARDEVCRFLEDGERPHFPLTI